MAETIDNRDPRRHRSWRELWQAPTLAAAVVLLLAGLMAVVVTRPRPDVQGMVAQAEQMIESNRSDDALALLNDRARPLIGEAYVTPQTRQRFHAARARAIADGIGRLGLTGLTNHQSVVDEYGKAEGSGYEMPPIDQRRLIASLIELGELDEAASRIDALPDDTSVARVSLRRSLIEAAAADPAFRTLADEQLLVLDGDPMLSVDDRAWVVARQTERRLDDGLVDEAVARLLRTMPRVTSASDAARGELFLLLGTAYAEVDAVADAAKQLDRASMLIEPNTELYASMRLTRGRVFAQLGELEQAREHFEEVVESYSSSPSFLDATLALAETVARISKIDPSLASSGDAVAAYARVADEARFAAASEAYLGRATRSLLRRVDEYRVRGQLDTAAQYGQIAEDLWGLSSAPPEVLLAQGEIRRATAQELIDDASQIAGRPVDLGDLDPSARLQGQRDFLGAADYFRRHADALAGDDDGDGYADSLWAAATMFDSGGDTGEAIASFIEFASTISDDPRLPEARFRLARAYQSAGQYDLAAEQYESLIEVASDPQRGTGVGPFAVRSYVPLAETYLEDADPANDARAGDLLEAVIRGEAGGIDGEAFSDALSAMGMVRYYRGDFPGAIETLEEAVARGDDDRRALRLKYLLADAYRLEAASITDTLGEGAIAPTVARDLSATRESHLNRAIELFSQVRDGGATIVPARRTTLESVFIRNAHFYLGDCAFDLGRYEPAIRYYGVAKDAYADDAASLVALVQIFNAYLELGDVDRARTASERARRFHESLPESAWDDRTLPMSRQDWERWLDSTYELASMQAADGLE
ncbi:MAG: tetratricopeptide repeat protein [Planctomycetota bacterium]